MAYFDNAATSFPKPEEVYQSMDFFQRNTAASFNRASYGFANSTRAVVDDTRQAILRILRCPAKKAVLEPSATIALNIILQGLVRKGAKNVYISPFEHNAVTRTLYHYEDLGQINVRQLAVAPTLEFDLQRIRFQFEDARPHLVALSHASNVIGLVAPAEEIFSLAKEHGAATVLDMSQSAGVVDCDVGAELFDFAVFAGHKTLLGPAGISGFVMKGGFDLEPVFFGGTGVDSASQEMPRSIPERFEFGTINAAGAAGLNASAKWILAQGIGEIAAKEEQNRARLISLLSSYDFISIVGNAAGQRYVGIVSCLIEGISSDTAGKLFAERNIAVRAGLHCAPLAHRFLNTFPAGTVRFSVNCLTREDDFAELKAALDDIGSELRA